MATPALTVETPFINADGTPATLGADVSTFPDLDGTFGLIATRSIIGQAVMRRLMTPRGALVNAPDYGVDLRSWLGASYTPDQLGRLASDIESEAEKDDRVLSASATVTANQQSMTLSITVILQTIQGPEIVQIELPNGSTAYLPSPANPVLPGAVTGLTPTPGSTQVALAWSAPSNAGLAGVTGYQITVLPGGATYTTASTSYMVTGLTNGTLYTFSVAAIGSYGEGPSVSTMSTPTAPSSFWTAATGVPTNYTINSVIEDSSTGNFIAVGSTPTSNGAILVSTDKGHSYADKSGGGNASVLSGVGLTVVKADGAGNIVMVGAPNSGGGVILLSTDGGNTVTAQTVPSCPAGGTWTLSDLAYNGSVWFAQGSSGGSSNAFLTATSPTSWTAHTFTTPANVGPVTATLGSIFANMNTSGATSPAPTFSCNDGVSWAEHDSAAIGTNIVGYSNAASGAVYPSIVGNGSILMAVGNDSAFTVGVNATSSDGNTWSMGTIPTFDQWAMPTYDGSKWIVVGAVAGATVTSSDGGATWTTQEASRAIEYEEIASDQSGHSVVFGFASGSTLAFYH